MKFLPGLTVYLKTEKHTIDEVIMLPSPILLGSVLNPLHPNPPRPIPGGSSWHHRATALMTKASEACVHQWHSSYRENTDFLGRNYCVAPSYRRNYLVAPSYGRNYCVAPRYGRNYYSMNR